MSIDAVTTFFALATLATLLLVVTFVASTANGSSRRAVQSLVGPIGIGSAAFIAGSAMAGSLYLSEVAHFTPCTLCWYQRIAMYSTALLLVTALVRRDDSIRPYATMLCVIGALISAYHVLVERFPNLESSTCDPNNPCSLKWVEKFGFVTIPLMAFSAFAAIICLLSIRPKHTKGQP
jgi:disulfide bond formation protein DsbB